MYKIFLLILSFIILDHELKSISYGGSYNDYTVGDKICLKPTIDDIIDVEEISIEGSIFWIIIIIIDLPDGLSFDPKSGIISGIAQEDCEKIFTIKVKNYLNEISYEIDLFILNSI